MRAVTLLLLKSHAQSCEPADIAHMDESEEICDKVIGY